MEVSRQMTNIYMSYPEGWEQLIKDLDLPMDDFEERKRFMEGWLNTVITN